MRCCVVGERLMPKTIFRPTFYIPHRPYVETKQTSHKHIRTNDVQPYKLPGGKLFGRNSWITHYRTTNTQKTTTQPDARRFGHSLRGSLRADIRDENNNRTVLVILVARRSMIAVRPVLMPTLCLFVQTTEPTDRQTHKPTSRKDASR